MRSFIISIISLLVMIGAYFGFITYTHSELEEMMARIDTEISQSVANEDWPAAQSQFEQLSDQWHDHKHVFSLFLDTSAMLDTDFAIARTRGYMETEEQSSALAELYGIREQMNFLYRNELINIDNVF